MIDFLVKAWDPFAEVEIQEIERVLGRPTPQDYRDFVTNYGGAFVGGSVDGEDEFSILEFFNAPKVLTKLESYADLRDDGILPFARCEFGNIYVTVSNGEIYYINYYGGETNVQRVAGSFGELLSRIVVTDD